MKRNELCWCQSGKKWKKCHYPQENPNFRASLADEYWKKYKIRIKTEDQIKGIKAACLLNAQILDAVCLMAKEGVTTKELNDYANKLYKDAGAIPAPLNYGHPPYPASICTSLNEVVCHGIPGPRVLQNGDIMNVDVSTILNGYYGDCSKMVTIGTVSPDKQLVVDTAYECLMKAIDVVKPGALLSEIGEAIESHAHNKDCSVVYQFVAHGVGVEFHENPQIPHCRNRLRLPIVEGMTFTIEPMINAGVAEAVIDPTDQWTATTKDKKPSAQWEHTLLVTSDGYEILTPWTK
ncbi:MAG: methionyl aminopeptidase [Parachlamydiales bacterium]|nr:methionyl aminopeptidase [Parachlamydiales bacterium]